MPLGSSSAAPVMRPGPNCFTREFSVMLLSRLTIAILQKRTTARAKEGVENGGSEPARAGFLEPFGPSATGGGGASEGLKVYQRPARVPLGRHSPPFLLLLTRPPRATD